MSIPQISEWGLPVSHLSKVIDEWIYNEAHRDIIKRHMLNLEGFEEISSSHNLSYERVREIYYEGRKQVYTHRNDIKTTE